MSAAPAHDIDTPWGEAILLSKCRSVTGASLGPGPRSGEPLEQSNDQKKTSTGVFFCAEIQ